MEKFKTKLGKIICADSRQYLPQIESNSVDLIFTSPPYLLQDRKAYGNVDTGGYLDWFLDFISDFHRVLKDSGSFVLNVGGSWNPGVPTRSLYPWRLLLAICDKYSFHLAQEFSWYKPSPTTTTEYAIRRKIRVKDAVEHIFWFSKTVEPKADITKVLYDYSDAYKKFLAQDMGQKLNINKTSHTGSDMHTSNLVDNGGRQPNNMLFIAPTGGDNEYCKRVQEAGLPVHPARFPKVLPLFFISMLTEPGDVVLDPFGGSCITGVVAEELERQWICIEMAPEYIEGALLRFKGKDTKQQTLFGG